MDDKVRAIVRAWLNNTWTDITTDVRSLDGINGLQLTQRGQLNESTRPTTTNCNGRLNNANGQWSDSNPNSPYYHQLQQNIPIQIGIDYAKTTFSGSASNAFAAFDTGQAWDYLGAAAQYAENSGFGKITTNSGALYAFLSGYSYGEAEALMEFSISSVTTDFEVGITTHFQATNQQKIFKYQQFGSGSGGPFYQVQVIDLHQSPSGSIGYASIASVALVPTTLYSMRISLGKRVRIKFWKSSDGEPANWTTDAYDTDLILIKSAQSKTGYCGKIGVYVNGGGVGTVVSLNSFEVFNPRASLQISSISPSTDLSGNDLYADFQANGILRQVLTGDKILDSAVFKDATKNSTLQYVYGYWPCEDEQNANAPSSGLSNGKPMEAYNTRASYASSSPFPGSKPLITVNTNSNFQANIPAGIGTGNAFFRMLLSIPSGGLTDQSKIATIITSGGSAAYYSVVYGTSGSGSLAITAFNSSNTSIDTTGFGFSLNGKRFYLSMELVQSGGDISVLLFTSILADDNSSISGSLITDTFTGLTLGRPIRLGVMGTGTNGAVFGHVGIANNQSFMFAGSGLAILGNAGETARTRISRLLTENGFKFYLADDDQSVLNDVSAQLGPQQIDTLGNNILSAAMADQGIIYEPRNDLAVGYRPVHQLFAQYERIDIFPIVDYSVGYLTRDALAPVNDDQLLANEVTASRTDGGFANVTITTGRKGTATVGSYRPNPPLVVNVYSDNQLGDVAGLRAALGTIDKPRFPNLSFDLMKSLFTVTNKDLRAMLLALDSGDYYTITNPPSLWLAPEAIDLMMLGGSETIGQKQVQVTFNNIPYAAYDAAFAQTGGMTNTETMRVCGDENFKLAVAVNTTATSFSVNSTDNISFFTTSADLPFQAMIEGELVNVTAVSGTTSPQTLTVTRSINAVVKAHGINAVIDVFKQARAAR